MRDNEHYSIGDCCNMGEMPGEYWRQARHEKVRDIETCGLIIPLD